LARLATFLRLKMDRLLDMVKQKTVLSASGPTGARAPRRVELALNKERVALCTLQATEALRALRLLVPRSVILKVAQLTVLWANGKIGDRVPQLAVEANKLALARSSLNPVMEVLHALLPLRLRTATLKVVQSIALLMNGKIGARAPKNVVAANNLALVRS